MHDLAISRPAVPGNARPRGASRGRARVRLRLPRFRHWGAVRRYGTRAVLWPGFAALMAVIVLNATAFQTGHHPAPLVPVAAEPAPAIPRQQASLDGDPVAAVPARRPATVAAAPAAGPAPAVAARQDGIATPPPAVGPAPGRDAKPARERVAKPGPGQPHAAPKPNASGPKPTDRQRLAAMMTAASKGRPAAAATN